MGEGEDDLHLPTEIIEATNVTIPREIDINTLGDMSQEELEQLVVPGTRFIGFNDIPAADSFLVSMGDSLVQHLLPPEEYSHYQGGIVANKGQTPINALAYHYTGTRDPARFGLTAPASFTILEPDKSDLQNPDSIIGTPINFAFSGQFGMRYRPNSVDDEGNPKYTNFYDVKDRELSLFVRNRKQGPSEPKPYLYCVRGKESDNKQARAYVDSHSPINVNSRNQWRNAITHALQHMLPGGAPGLGKSH